MIFLLCPLSISMAAHYLLKQKQSIDIRGFIPYTDGRSSERSDHMPTISYFYGIIIVMYLRNKEHNPPHIHAITQDFLKYQNELLEMWETEKYKKLPPLN